MADTTLVDTLLSFFKDRGGEDVTDDEVLDFVNKNGLEDITPEEVHECMPQVVQSISTGASGGYASYSGSGSIPSPPAGSSVAQTLKHYNNYVTNITDNSRNANVFNQGDGGVTIDQSGDNLNIEGDGNAVATGDGAQAQAGQNNTQAGGDAQSQHVAAGGIAVGGDVDGSNLVTGDIKGTFVGGDANDSIVGAGAQGVTSGGGDVGAVGFGEGDVAGTTGDGSQIGDNTFGDVGGNVNIGAGDQTTVDTGGGDAFLGDDNTKIGDVELGDSSAFSVEGDATVDQSDNSINDSFNDQSTDQSINDSFNDNSVDNSTNVETDIDASLF